MNFTPALQSQSHKTHRDAVALRVLWSKAASFPCRAASVEKKGEQRRGPCSLCGPGSQGHLLDVSNQIPLSGFSGIAGQCQPR